MWPCPLSLHWQYLLTTGENKANRVKQAYKTKTVISGLVQFLLLILPTTHPIFLATSVLAINPPFCLCRIKMGFYPLKWSILANNVLLLLLLLQPLSMDSFIPPPITASTLCVTCFYAALLVLYICVCLILQHPQRSKPWTRIDAGHLQDFGHL